DLEIAEVGDGSALAIVRVPRVREGRFDVPPSPVRRSTYRACPSKRSNVGVFVEDEALLSPRYPSWIPACELASSESITTKPGAAAGSCAARSTTGGAVIPGAAAAEPGPGDTGAGAGGTAGAGPGAAGPAAGGAGCARAMPAPETTIIIHRNVFIALPLLNW